MNFIHRLKSIRSRLKRNSSNTEFITDEEILLTDEDGENMSFKGEMRDGKPNRFGEAIFEGGDLYLGYFKDQKREGIGMYKWESGDYYVGNWSKNKRKGFGVNYSKKANSVMFGDFEGTKLIHEKGRQSKLNSSKICNFCGKSINNVEVLIKGGIKGSGICNSCIVETFQLLKEEMNYNESDVLGLLKKESTSKQNEK